MKSITHNYLLLLCMSCSILFCGCKDKIKNQKTTTQTVENPTKKSPQNTAGNQDKVSKTNPGEQPPPATPVNEPTTDPGTITSGSSLAAELCKSEDFDLVGHLVYQAKRIEKDSIPYDSNKGNDCSGIFHRYLNTVKGLCPTSIYPTMATARSTRGLGKWYHDNGNLTIIRDPKAAAELIKPGVVMFYGYGNRYKLYDHSTLTIDSLTTRGRGINHVAVVVSVSEKDGVLDSYEIFHGRNPRHPAGITSCVRYNPRQPDFPTYGNWNEPWLAVADILTADRN